MPNTLQPYCLQWKLQDKITESRFQSLNLDVYTNQNSHLWTFLLQNLFPTISSIKHDLLYLNFVSTSIIRISSYILCLLSSKKNINTSQSHQAILVDCHNTFQFLGGEDIMLPSVSYSILRMKTANGIKTLANQLSECSVNAKNWKYNCSQL